MLVRRRAALRREPSQSRSSFTFEAILDAAEQILLAEGAQSLQMSVLARRAGVSAGTLYQYFPDKLSVLMSLHDRSTTRFMREVRRAFIAVRTAAVEVVLEHVSGVVIEHALRDHRLRLILRPDLEAAGDIGERVDLSEEAAQFISGELRSKVAATPERMLTIARVMVWAADGLLEGALRRTDVSAPDLRTALLFAWRGILAGT